MKDFTHIIELLADGYYELTKQAKMKDAVESGINKVVGASRKVPSIIFVLFTPTLSYIIGFALLVYSISRYFLTQTPNEAISLGITGVVMIFFGAAVGFYYQKKLDSMIAREEENTSVDFIPMSKSGPINDLLTQFSKEQNEIIENITSKFR